MRHWYLLQALLSATVSSQGTDTLVLICCALLLASKDRLVQRTGQSVAECLAYQLQSSRPHQQRLKFRSWQHKPKQIKRRLIRILSSIDKPILRPGTHYPHVTWAHVMLRVQLGYLTLNSCANSHFCQICLRHVIWRGALVGSRASTPLKFLLSHTFHETWRTCRVLFRHCYQLFPEMEEMLIEKVRQRTFYVTPSHHIIDTSIWEPTHGKK
jgi:hypothetical protein